MENEDVTIGYLKSEISFLRNQLDKKDKEISKMKTEINKLKEEIMIKTSGEDQQQGLFSN